MAGLNHEQIKQYLVDQGMADPMVERNLLIVDDIESLVTDPIEHVFVSDYRDEDGNRYYESLWLFTEKYISEAHGYLTDRTTFDVVPIDLGFARIEISREHFDLSDTAASDQARLAVKVNFSTSSDTGLVGKFKASGSNCLVLAEVVRDYLMPLVGAR